MASGFTLAFSTGDSLDRASIAGRVHDPEPAGVTIFAYLLNGIAADTLNPGTRKPDYVMQTGNNGDYRISNVAYGSYRVMAFRDHYKNFLYDRQIDQYGVAFREVSLTAEIPEVSGVSFRMTVEDTTAPFLSSVQATSSRHVTFRFSESIDSTSFRAASFSIEDTLGSSVDHVMVYQTAGVPASGGIVTVSPLDPGGAYLLTVRGAIDSAGVPIDTANASLLFGGNGDPDTLSPKLSFLSFADTVMGYPLSRPIAIGFSEPVLPEPFERGLRLAGPDEEPVPLTVRWLSPVHATAEFASPMKPATSYMVSIVPDSVRDLSGNAVRDSVIEKRFATFNPLRSGEVRGRVRCTDCPDGKALYVSVRLMAEKSERVTRADDDGAFQFEHLAPGKYTLAVFRDDDSSGGYSYGLPYPFTSTEPFVASPDTIRVRARWAVEGILIRFP
jgi:hypothetical protein